MGHNYNSPEDRATAFNMGLATLERINNLLRGLANYNIINDVSGIKNTILELYKETSVYLNKEQKKEGNEFWDTIEEYKVKSIDSTSISYNPELLGHLHDFDFWLREILHKKGILMPKGEDPYKIMSKTKGW